MPTLELHTGAGSDHAAEARHVSDALLHPQRTFPSFANKKVPGLAGAPLHRMMSETLKTKNTDGAIAICKDVWGEEYPAGNQQCDEYPFKTTYEGAATSTGATEQNPNAGKYLQWSGSARPIDGKQNENGGNHLGLFYGQNRILDENSGTARHGQPSEPFFVAVVP
ncbi:hypothetical protein [Symbioplanes lichenis]|uniref:hypothetical protein n=1 Tax=Symbioplanes lichenis TaxID=1629072 RepID=UPI0027390CB1|nr:hypothetical protein [Actinoplanes lichenis]